MLAKKYFLVGILTLLSLSLAISAQPLHPTTGEPLMMDCLRGTPDAIDGDLSDWNLEAMTPAVLDAVEQLSSGQDIWTGPEDCSGKFYMMWDDVNIYMAVVVKDDKLVMNKTDGSIWNSDCVEMFFATTDAEAEHPWTNPTIHYQYGFNANNQTWNWCNMHGPGQSVPDYLQVASSVTADGYICEASIEYGQMLSLDFSAGNTIGLHPCIDDTDIDDGNTEYQMSWTGLPAHDQSMGYGHMLLSSDSVPEPEPVLSGLADVTVEDGAIISMRYADTEYVVANGDLILGTTTRWYIPADTGIPTLWVEGNPAPAATVSGTSGPKEGDVGSNADNFFFSIEGDADNISSIDGIDYQETIFPFLTNTVFVFERGGNDTGMFQAIFEDGSLGAEVAFDKASNGGPYADTGVGVNGQNAYGVVFTTAVPAIGVRITASGHDTLSISIPAPEPVDPGSDGLVAYYALENDVNDSSGNGLDGTIVGEPTYVEGPAGYGTAMAFDGVDDYIDFGNDARFDITEQVTLAVWVNANDMLNGEHNPWLGKGDHCYAIKHQSGNYLEFFIYDGGWHSTVFRDYDESMNGEWYHMAGTYDGSELKFYLDGELSATLIHEGSIETREHPVTMGTNSEAGGRFYDGALDEAMIYNRALSVGEIRYLAGFRVPIKPVHSYTFEDGTGNDSVGDADGVLVGDAAIVDGSLVVDGDGDWMEMPGEVIAISTYSEMTLELWSTQSVDNPFSMTASFGGTWGNGMGKDYIFIATGRGDQMNRGAIANTPDEVNPWEDEVGVSSPELNDGIEHQYVLTITAEELAYYVDGILIGTAPMGDTAISGVSNDFVFLGKGIYSVDPTMNCSINEFNIYDVALSAEQIVANFVEGPVE